MRGFTLIELAVTIGVLAVLTAVSLPAIAGSADSARGVACAANLRTLHAGLVLRMDATDGLLPFAAFSPDFARGFVAPFDELSLSLDARLPARGEDAFERSQPWACPADRVAGPALGTSYRYVPADFFAVHRLGAGARGEVTRLFLGDPGAVLFIDALAFHGPGNGGRVVVRSAGHAGRLDDRGLLPGLR
jgi:prepilin-type N-terminal cleavage/methylation domain-containing protein